MNKISKSICASIFILVLTLQIVLAGNVYLFTPKMVIRTEIGDSGEANITQSIGVRNEKEYSVDVKFDISDSLKGLVELEEQEFVLASNEERWINFTMSLTKAGEYSGEIISVFSGDGGDQPIGLSSQIIVLVEGEEEKDSLINVMNISFLVLVIILVIIIFYYHKKSFKKRKKLNTAKRRDGSA